VSPSGAERWYISGIVGCCILGHGAQLTKLKEDVKAKLEDDFRSGGQRTATQVSSASEIQLPGHTHGSRRR